MDENNPATYGPGTYPDTAKLLFDQNRRIMQAVLKRPTRLASQPGLSALDILIDQLEVADQDRFAWRTQCENVTIERHLLELKLEGERHANRQLKRNLASLYRIIKAGGKVYSALVHLRRNYVSNYLKATINAYEADQTARAAIAGYIETMKSLKGLL